MNPDTVKKVSLAIIMIAKWVFFIWFFRKDNPLLQKFEDFCNK